MTCHRCSTWGFFSRRLQPYWLGALLAALLLAGSAPRGAVSQDTGVEALLRRGRETGADATRMQMVARRARQSGLNTDATARLLRPAVRLAEEGLPSGPVLAKTLEGLTKRVPIARMRPVLLQQRVSVQRAAQVVGQWSTAQTKGGAQGKAPDELITAAAEALRDGAPPKDIEAFLNGLPENARRPASARRVAAATAVLPDLLEAGSAPKATRRLLTSAVEAGVDPESIRQLPSALQGARREKGRPVGALAEGAAKALARGAPATRVLGGLFPGGVPGGGLPGGAGPPGTTPGVGKPPVADPPAGPPSDPSPTRSPPGGGG